MKGLTEFEEIIINLQLAVENGELTRDEAVELLDNFQDHEFESLPELVFALKEPAKKG